MKIILSFVLAVMMMAGTFTGCISAPGDDTPPEPTPTPRIYTPNPWTGEKIDETFPKGQRAVAIMINNISACRPQRGLSQASILFESKVEGGITRFMGIFEDYTTLEATGPVRSGRDQFLQWAIPMDVLYCHIGRSEITQTYIDTFEYNDRDLDGGKRNFIYRIDRPGKAYEHTAYTDARTLSATLEKYEYNMNKTYEKPVFDFVDYDENNGIRVLEGENATDISIVHSEVYRTYFEYDETTNRYMMSQYNGTLGTRQPTIDENTGEQIGFENVFVNFADISKYPYPGGGKGDPNYQKVDLSYGSVGYYFSGGKVEKIRWFKGQASDELEFTDWDENSLKVNCGKSYIGFVDFDEAERFEYVGPAEEIVEEEIDTTQDVTTEVEFE